MHDLKHELSLEEWRSYEWWPNDKLATIRAGLCGHEREIVVNFDDYYISPGDYSHQIPDSVFDQFVALLPESWYVENRGSRIEVHPTGAFAGGYTDDDVAVVRKALRKLGLIVE